MLLLSAAARSWHPSAASAPRARELQSICGAMEKEDKVPQYKTIKRLQKNYLVRCNDSLKNIIPHSPAGVKPNSQIRRIEEEIKAKRREFRELTEQAGRLESKDSEAQVKTNKQELTRQLEGFAQDKEQITLQIKELEKKKLELEIL